MQRSRIIASALAIVAALTAAELLVLPSARYNGAPRFGRARITSCQATAEEGGYSLSLAVTSGPSRGRSFRLKHTALAGSQGGPAAGSEVIVRLPADDADEVTIVGLARDRGLMRVAALLILLMVFAGGGRGVRGILILAFVAAVMCGAVGPLVARGLSPLLCVLAAAVVMIVVASVCNVGRQRTAVAVMAGSAGGLAVVLVLSFLSVRALHLTGVYSWLTRGLWEEEATRALNFPQLLIAGMTLGALGVVIDLATAVASAVREVGDANPSLGRRERFASGLSVGRDVMGTELNTLVFAYVGANVGALLLPVLGERVAGYEIPALHVFNTQAIAVELSQILVGTIGLVLTIPITAFVASLIVPPSGAPVTRDRPASQPALRRSSFRWPALAAVIGCLLGLWILAERWESRRYHAYRRRPSESSSVERLLVRAEVTSAQPPREELLGRSGALAAETFQQTSFALVSGPRRGAVVEGINPLCGRPDHDKPVGPGDEVLLRVRLRDGEPQYAGLLEYARGGRLLSLAFLLLGLVCLVGQWNGMRATAALACSGVIIYGCALAVGVKELLALPTFLAAMLPLSVVVFLILCGPTRKAASAALGAFGGIFVGGLAALLCATQLGFSGLHDENLRALWQFAGAQGVDYRGLYAAGVLLGVVGVAMDVAIAIASAAAEVQLVKPEAGRREVFERALRVGRNVMTPMVLALVFAYLGINLPILILPLVKTDTPLALFVNRDPVSAEGVRILAGSIGVVATVPITAMLCALFARTQTSIDGGG